MQARMYSQLHNSSKDTCIHMYLELLPIEHHIISCFVLMTCNDLTVLTCPPPSCIILLCFLYVQTGMTPVLIAAFNGHTSIIELLVDQYHCSLTDVNNVSALDVLQCNHEPLCLVGLMLVSTPLEVCSPYHLRMYFNSRIIIIPAVPQIL